MGKRPLILLLVLALLLSAGCHLNPEEEKPGRLLAVATIFPVGDILTNLGGTSITLVTLLPPGASPHTYEPRMEQVKAVSSADLFIYVGAGLDDWALKLTAAGSPARVLELSSQINLEEGSPPGTDPHLWLDPVIVREQLCPLLVEELVRLLPERERKFRSNLTIYQEQLARLDQEIRRATSALRRRKFISMHSAWTYFAQRYNLQEVAAVTLSPGQEPSAARVTEVIELAIEQDVGAILAEPQLPTRLAERIAEESGCKLFIADPLGGSRLPGRDSYLGLMRYNLDLFRQALN
ncbi:MAG: zinc ABC transporter substrate-binding protein [Firmicutes bacterium]|nr:zinc ABC transporter substrate-binding protein [Bacillota bacterium]